MKKSPAIALCAAQPIVVDGDQAVPDWLHLLPAGPIVTNDGRGPYEARDLTALMAASLPEGDKLVLDENHSTDLAAPRGDSAPARGWIVELAKRADGIWGRVEWTAAGRMLMKEKAYRGVSPVIAHRENGEILAIRRASLTNTPNFTGLQSLHQEEDVVMNFRDELIKALGLDSDATDEAILAAIAKMKEAPATSLQSALSPIATAAGLAADAGADAVLAGVQQLVAKAATGGSDNETITALQAELGTVTNRLNGMIESGARSAATTFVDGAIAAGHVGVKPLRDRYITMHMADASGTEELISALPRLQAGAVITADRGKGENGELSDTERQVISLMGMDPAAYKATLAAEAKAEEIL